jgi:hypothetical protein
LIDAFDRITKFYNLNPRLDRAKFVRVEVRLLRFIVRFDALESRAYRVVKEPGTTFLPESDDKYAAMIRDILPAKPTLVQLNFVLLFHVGREDKDVCVSL